jgi:branched-chain amino acid transport system ATP-binding protein
MLKVADLEVAYGDFQVIWGVSLEVNEGEVVSLMGPNGSGKSTILNTRLGGYHPAARGARGETIEQVYRLFPRLRERESQQAYSLSGGEQQMLALGRGIMSRPKLLMVDEPFLGLSPAVVKEMTEAFMRIQDSGVSILFIEQNVQVALNMSQRGYILESGRLVLEGAANDLLGSDEVKRIFLGG